MKKTKTGILLVGLSLLALVVLAARKPLKDAFLEKDLEGNGKDILSLGTIHANGDVLR